MAAGSGGRLFEERRQLKVTQHFAGQQECNDHLEERLTILFQDISHLGWRRLGMGVAFFCQFPRLDFGPWPWSGNE